MKESANSFYPQLIFIEGVVKCGKIIIQIFLRSSKPPFWALLDFMLDTWLLDYLNPKNSVTDRLPIFCHDQTICIADCENLTIGHSLEWKLHNPTNHSNTSVSWWLENKRGKQPRPKCCWIWNTVHKPIIHWYWNENHQVAPRSKRIR